MTKINAEKLDILLFIIQNTEWTNEEVMEMYYLIEEELDPFQEDTSKPRLQAITKELH